MKRKEEHPEQPTPVTITSVSGGALIQAFDLKLAEVLENIQNINMPATAKRSITLTLDILPREDRIQLDTKFTCNAKLSSLVPADGRLYIGKDEDGNLYALNKDPRQQNLFTPPQPEKVREPIAFTGSK